MKEIIEMMQMLQEMGTDTYMRCKYTVQAVSREQQRAEDFVDKLFSLTDRKRPLLIEMKRGGVMANFAAEIISEAVKKRNFWRLVAAISIALNIIQWMF